MDFETLGAAKKYVAESLEGAGALKGDKGDDGADGKSAYETAVDGGYLGTEEEFAEALNPEEIDIDFTNWEDE